MIVYLVMSWNYSDTAYVGVYSSMEKAKEKTIILAEKGRSVWERRRPATMPFDPAAYAATNFDIYEITLDD